MKNTRREFLKKVAYTAPSVVALGSLVAPTSASAFGNGGFGGFGGNIGGQSSSTTNKLCGTLAERREARRQAINDRLQAIREAHISRIQNHCN